MSRLDDPDDIAGSEQDAELRTFRRIAGALEQATWTSWPPRSGRNLIRRGPGREHGR